MLPDESPHEFAERFLRGQHERRERREKEKTEKKLARRLWWREVATTAFAHALGTLFAALVIILGGSLLGVLSGISTHAQIVLGGAILCLAGGFLTGSYLFRSVSEMSEIGALQLALLLADRAAKMESQATGEPSSDGEELASSQPPE